MYDVHAGYILLIAGAVTATLRFLPFIAFGKKKPEAVMYLGRVLPPAVLYLVIFGPDNFLMPAMGVITLMLFMLRERIENV